MPERLLHIAFSAAAALPEALSELQAQLPQPVQHGRRLGLLLSTPHYAPQGLNQALQKHFPELELVAFSSEGLLVNRQIYTEGLALGILDLPDLRFAVASAGPVSSHGFEAGQKAVRQALQELNSPAQEDITLLVLIDALAGNPAEVLEGAFKEAGSRPRWIGGGVGHIQHKTPAFMLARQQVQQDRVVVLALQADQPWRCQLGHGWQPLPVSAFVNQARQAILKELNYQPAYQTYQEMARSAGLPFDPAQATAFFASHPLGIPLSQGQYLIRDPIGVDAHGALHCVADIAEGSLVHLMQGSPAELIAAAGALGQQVRGGAHLGGTLVFDCVSRYHVLGPTFAEELVAIENALGHSPLLGALSFGEVGSSTGGAPLLHNKSLGLLAWTR